MKNPNHAKKKMGAPVKLTEKVQDDIVKAITMGCYVETAAAIAGIHKDTYYEWLRKGAKQSKGIYKEFSDAVRKALAMSELRDLSVIDLVAQGQKAQYTEDPMTGERKLVRPEIAKNWQAAAWKLERKFPTKWGRLDRHEHTGKDGAPLTFVQLIQELEAEDENTE
jgi:hypothetical protein